MELLPTKYRLMARKLIAKYKNAFFSVLAILAMLLSLVFFVLFISTSIANNRKSSQLNDIMFQDIEKYKLDDLTKNEFSSRDTIDDMISLEKEL